MKYARHIYVLHQLCQVPRAEDTGHSQLNAEESVKLWDELYEYIFLHWASPSDDAKRYWNDEIPLEVQALLDECRQMLKMSPAELEERLQSLPPVFSEYIFPVSVARHLLRDLRLQVGPRMLKTFEDFYLRYGALVLQSV